MLAYSQIQESFLRSPDGNKLTLSVYVEYVIAKIARETENAKHSVFFRSCRRFGRRGQVDAAGGSMDQQVSRVGSIVVGAVSSRTAFVRVVA